MTIKQWHSNDRKSKINTRTWVKNIKKTGNEENILLLLLGLLHTTKWRRFDTRRQTSRRGIADWRRIETITVRTPPPTISRRIFRQGHAVTRLHAGNICAAAAEAAWSNDECGARSERIARCVCASARTASGDDIYTSCVLWDVTLYRVAQKSGGDCHVMLFVGWSRV